MSWGSSPQSLTLWRVLQMTLRRADWLCLSGPYRGSPPTLVWGLHCEHRWGLLSERLSRGHHWSERGGGGHRDLSTYQCCCIKFICLSQAIFFRMRWLVLLTDLVVHRKDGVFIFAFFVQSHFNHKVAAFIKRPWLSSCCSMFTHSWT